MNPFLISPVRQGETLPAASTPAGPLTGRAGREEAMRTTEENRPPLREEEHAALDRLSEAYTSAAPAADVQARIQALNPGLVVVTI